MKLIRNASRCKKCNTIIESKYRHDFVSCKCGSIFVDGGLEYSRSGWPEGDPEEWIEDLSEFSPENGQGVRDGLI